MTQFLNKSSGNSGTGALPIVSSINSRFTPRLQPVFMRKKFILAASLVFAVLGRPTDAQTVPTVAVRAGAHSDYDRVVFDWPRNVKYTLNKDGTHAAITFDAAADIKFSPDVQSYLTRARGFAVHTDGGGHVIVSFETSPGSTIKTFTSSTSVVVDITGKSSAGTQANPSSQPLASQSLASQSLAKTPVVTPIPATPPASAAPPPIPSSPAASSPTSMAQTTQATPIIPSAAPPLVLPDPTTNKAHPLVADTPSTASSPTKASTTVHVSSPAQPQAPAASQAPAPPSDPASPPLVLPTPTATPNTDASASTPVPQASIVSGAPPSKKLGDSTIILSDASTLIAGLDPHIPTRAAVYERADVGYIFFDRKLTLSPAALENGVPAQIDLQPIDMAKNSGYRFALPPNSELHVTLDGTQWKIYVSKKDAVVPVTTGLVAQPDFALGARLLLPLPDAPDPIHYTDPIVGDDLIIVPLAQSEAFNTIRHMSDLTVLAAAQGMVIKPRTDKVIVRPVSDGIEITADGGLLLSRSIDTGASQQSASKARAAAAGKSIFDFATWIGKPGETFTQTRQRLQQTIVDVPEAERNRARLELARFYFASGNGEESLGLLNYLIKQVPDLKVHADFMGLYGATEVLSYRAEDGLNDLSLPILADQPEIDLWQAVALAQLRDWPHAEEKFAIRESILTGYPEPFFSRFFVLAIESALATDKDHEAADWLDYLTSAPHDASIEPAIFYLRGALHAKAGRADAAETAWKEAASSNDRLYKVRADLALVDLGVSTGSLTPAQAADRLEALRFGWRGDDLEVDILHRLGQFYIQAKNVKAGLNAMSQAVTLYPASPLTPKIRSEMESTFRDVFLGDLGKKLSPLDSLTLYQQYRDLMPTGKDGDVVMNNLAERLIAVDLLDQAASLLDDLAKNRLQGPDKDRVALRLAGIRLLDHRPEDAITALNMIGNDVMPAPMQNEQVLLRARALSEMHKDAEATALLKDNTTEGAKMLRADIAMHGQQWSDAAKALMDLAGPPPPSGKVLTTNQSQWLLNAAIAYALDNDQTGLDKLAIDYSAAMSGTPQNDTFRILTEPEKTGQLRDLAAAQSQITQVDMFQGFLNTYRSAPAPDAAKKP